VLCVGAAGVYVPHNLGDVSTRYNFALNYESVGIFVVGDFPFAWMRRLRRGSADARLPGLRVRILPGVWMSVSYECCVLSGRGLCDRPISHPGESYSVCVCVCVSSVARDKIPLHLQWVSWRNQRRKEERKEWRKKGRRKERKKEFPLSVKQPSGGDRGTLSGYSVGLE